MRKEYIKRFGEWNRMKEIVDLKDSTPILIREGAVWLAHLGVNIGSEVDGKGEQFARPVVVFRKVDASIFIGIPVSSKINEDNFRIKFSMLGENRVAIISQIRSYDRKRCIRLIDMLGEGDLKRIESRVNEFFARSRNPSTKE